MDQAKHYEWRGDTGENEDMRTIEDYEDYACNGGELSYEDWIAEKIEAAEIATENFWEEMAEISDEVYQEEIEEREIDKIAERQAERAEFIRDMLREDGININREE